MATLIPLALKISILLTVFAIGLSTRATDISYVLHRPRLLLRSLLAISLIMPAVAAFMAAVLHLKPAVQIALLALSVSPIPPLLPKKAVKAGGGASYAIGLLVIVALLAIVFVPLSVHILGRIFGVRAELAFTAVAHILAANVLAPLGAGVALSHFARDFAARIARPVSLTASILLGLTMIPIAINAMPPVFTLIGQGTLAATAAFVLAGIAAGHMLGGPEPANRAVLALTASSRHPGVAGAIATANFPHQKQALSAIFLYLLVNAAISIPYRVWCRRHYGDRMNPAPAAAGA
jgi:BASS family bile acid:Na+ symporter